MVPTYIPGRYGLTGGDWTTGVEMRIKTTRVRDADYLKHDVGTYRLRTVTVRKQESGYGRCSFPR